MKIIRESLYDPHTDCKTCITTYIAETLQEYRVCKAVLTRNSYRFLKCLGDKGDKTSLNQMFYNIYNNNFEHKKCFVKLFLIDYMEE